ncbi:MAG: MFS transporter [Acidimicrobiia bacterium]|nr:MFS transporter [Acidimicrobiia bacterium]
MNDARSFGERTFGALKYKWFRWTWIGAFLSTAGSWLQSVVLQFIVASTYQDEFLSGLISFLNFIPALLFGLVGGVVADRVSRLRLLITTQWLELGLAGAMALAFALGWDEYWVVALLTFALGVAISVNGPTYFAFFPSLVEPRDLASAVSLNSMQFNIGRVIGPGAGAFLLAALGAPVVFGINSLSYVALIIPLHLIPGHREKPPATGETGWQSFTSGFRYVRRKPWLQTMLLNRVVQALFAAQVVTLLAVFAVKELGYEAEGTGFLFSAFGVGGVVGAIAAASITTRVRRELLIPAVITAIGVTQVALAFARSTPLVLVAIFLSGVVYIGGGQTAFQTIIQIGVSDEMRGRVMAMLFTIFVGLFPIGALVWGFIARSTGVAFTFWVGGLVMVVYGLAVFARPRWLAESAAGSVEAGEPPQGSSA